MKKFLSFLLAAAILLSVCPHFFAEAPSTFDLPVLPDGHPEDKTPPIPADKVAIPAEAVFFASAIEPSGDLSVSILESGDYFTGIIWTASVSGGSGSYTYEFYVIKPVDENGKTINYSYDHQFGTSDTFQYTFKENGDYQLWVNVTDTEDNSKSAKTKQSVSVHVDGHDPLTAEVADNGLYFTAPTIWTVNAAGGSGQYQYYFELCGLFPYPAAGVSYSKGFHADNSFSYQFLANGDYELRVWVRDEESENTLFVHKDINLSEPGYLTIPEKVSEIVSQCRAAGCTTDYEIALWLHDWLIYNANYDYTYTHYGPDAVLLGDTGECDSYSKAYLLLLTEAGIPADRATNDNHAWNVLQVSNDWYYVDAAWDDPNEGGYERHLYFCIPDEILSINHPNYTSPYICDSYAYNYFVQNGDGANWADALTTKIQSGLQAGDYSFTIQLAESYVLEGTQYSSRSDFGAVLADKIALTLAQGQAYSYDNESVPLVMSKALNSDTSACVSINTVGRQLALPEKLSSIEEEAFFSAGNALAVTIPSNVTSIGSRAFMDFDSLWYVSIPASVTSFGSDVFDRNNKHLTVSVEEGSAAEQYAIQNGLKYEVQEEDRE